MRNDIGMNLAVMLERNPIGGIIEDVQMTRIADERDPLRVITRNESMLRNKFGALLDEHESDDEEDEVLNLLYASECGSPRLS